MRVLEPAPRESHPETHPLLVKMLGAAFVPAAVVFYAVCLRLVAVACFSAENPALCALVGGAWLAAGIWRRGAAMQAFALLWPVGMGLISIGLLPADSGPSFSFSALVLAVLPRLAGRLPSALRAASASWPARWILGSVAVLSLALAGSLVRECFRIPPAEWTRVWRQPEFGFSDPLFFLTAGHLWLAGGAVISLVVIGAAGDLPAEQWARTYAAALCWGYGLTSIGFLFFQYAAGLPSFYPYTVDGVYSVDVPTSLWRDHHVLGSVSLLLLGVTVGRLGFSRANRVGWLLAVALLAALVLSYSRAAWLMGGVGALAASGVRSWRWTALLLVVGVAAAITISANTDQLKALNQPYVTRLVNTVNLPRRIISGEEVRTRFYRSGLSMVADAPWTGLGIGRSFFTSATYNQRGEREFLHNTVLQLTAETGVFAGGAFLALLAFPFVWLGRVGWRGLNGTERALWCGWSLYLLTQLTANEVNVYFDQQLLFAAVYGAWAGSVIRRVTPVPSSADPRPSSGSGQAGGAVE